MNLVEGLHMLIVCLEGKYNTRVSVIYIGENAYDEVSQTIQYFRPSTIIGDGIEGYIFGTPLVVDNKLKNSTIAYTTKNNKAVLCLRCNRMLEGDICPPDECVIRQVLET